MITIIEDKLSYIKDSDKLIVESYKDYILGYSQIQIAAQLNSDLTVVVRNSHIYRWFQNLSERYENHIFEFKSITYKSYLEDLWNIKIPNDYSSDELEELDLVNLEETPRPNDIFEDFILTYFYDPVFTYNNFSVNLVVPFLKAFDKDIWEKNNQKILLRKLYNNRVQTWKSKLRDEKLENLLDDLFSNPVDLEKDLMLYKILRHDIYDDENLRKIALGDKYNSFKTIGLNLRDLEIDTKKIDTTLKQIDIHLNTLGKPKSTDEFENLIQKMSGLIQQEFDFIENLLKEKPELVSSTMISQLKAVFNPIYTKIGKRIENLKNLIMPLKPNKIDIDDSIENVRRWVTEEYLPYYNWTIKNQYFDNDLAEIADSFSSWLYENWEDVRANSHSLVANWLYKNSSSFNLNDKVNVVLIIDNLSWTNVDILQNLFSENSFLERSRAPYYSMVPSETETSKKCLLSGKTHYNEIDQSSYEKILNKGWVPFFESEKFVYNSDVDKFEKTKLEKGKTYFLNYRPIDDTLHKSSGEIGLSHSKQINTLLKDLVERANDHLDKQKLKEDAIVHVISDHGSTQINSKALNELDLSLFKKKEMIKHSDRFMFLSDEEFSRLPDNLKFDCFFLEKNRFGLPYHCLCARRNNTFKKYTDNSFLHGGLSPEEVVVPHLVFEQVEITIENPLLNLLRNKFRYKVEEIEIQIDNQNELPLTDIRVSIVNSNVESNPTIVDYIGAKSKQTIKIKARFKKNSNKIETEELRIDLNYYCNNQVIKSEKKFEIQMVSMVELKDTSVFDI